jgi:hypothetical protein
MRWLHMGSAPRAIAFNEQLAQIARESGRPAMNKQNDIEKADGKRERRHPESNPQVGSEQEDEERPEHKAGDDGVAKRYERVAFELQLAERHNPFGVIGGVGGVAAHEIVL